MTDFPPTAHLEHMSERLACLYEANDAVGKKACNKYQCGLAPRS